MSTSAGSAQPRDDSPNRGDSRKDTAPRKRSERRHGESDPHGTDPDQRWDRESVVEREKEQFGGIKIGSAFFGWLTATGTAVLLSALATALGAAVSAVTGTDVAAGATEDPQTAGIVGIVVLLVILLVAYYCGGYVAGRMARFNGMKQGIAVWVWAVVIAIIVAILGVIAGDQFNILAQIQSFPQIPVNPAELTTPAIIAAVVAAVVALIGAILGGLAGMRFHRKVDKAGLGN